MSTLWQSNSKIRQQKNKSNNIKWDLLLPFDVFFCKFFALNRAKDSLIYQNEKNMDFFMPATIIPSSEEIFEGTKEWKEF